MMPKLKQLKEMSVNLMTFSVLVSVIINCHACMGTPLGGDAEGQKLNPLKDNQAAYQGGPTGGHRWMPWHENPLYQRYHAPGTDFAGRYPAAAKSDNELEATTDTTEEDPMVSPVGLDLAELENIMNLLNSQNGLNVRKKRYFF